MIETKYTGPLRPHRISNKLQEMFWANFLEKGTNHSGQGMTLPHIINRCERERVPYRLTAYPGQGYRIEPIEPLLKDMQDDTNQSPNALTIARHGRL